VKHIRTTAFACALLLNGATAASAHDTFIMPDTFRVSPGQKVVVGFHSSDAFPESSTVMKRLQDPTVRSASGMLRLDNVKEDGKRLTGSFVVSGTGHIIVSAVNGTTVDGMKHDEFLEYLTEEGLTSAIAAHARGKTGAEAHERYTMYSKSILLSGAPSDGYRAVVGHPIEIVPDKDPYALKPGELLPVRVLLRGRPAGDVLLKAASTTPNGKQHDVGRTDANGRIDVPVSPGKWRLHTIAMEQVQNDAGAEWESHWATLTFEVP
jgi:uncharacterized GH25 family protein